MFHKDALALNQNSIRDETEQNYLLSFGFAGFRVLVKSVKHRNIEPMDSRRGNKVVIDVRTTTDTDDYLLGLLERQYLVGIINKRQRAGPNLPEFEDDFTITLYEPWKIHEGLHLML